MRISSLWFMDGVDDIAYARWCPADYRADAARRALRRIRRKMLGEAVVRLVFRFFRGLRGSPVDGLASGSTSFQKPSGESLVCARDGAAESFPVSLGDIRGVYDPDGTVRDGITLPRHVAPSIWERFYFGEIQLEPVPQVWPVGTVYYIRNDPSTLLAIMALRARGVPTILVRPLLTEKGKLTGTPASMAECNWHRRVKTGQCLKRKGNIIPTC
ncbi:hypothetical protein SAMN05920897_106143 [Alkalispirochaeta americana]|uniref:Uncharacterized protein n=1 Tax=Alkalispirochaeta americana TaxID=159291 RepID=A0A1N6RKJ6_9SPIO|nr:hypothetical protein [Alkalispirochaeta americana]SIQ29232.1 hypothetical protein SAMN05920897_106143 [Alkalispirochaeta americana]